jgi:hypothetical protein
MPRQQPPSDEVFAHAAELRAAGATWDKVAKAVNRVERTVRGWTRKYADRWADALFQAERRMASQSDCESVLTLRKLLVSQDEKIRWHAAKCLVNRRLERDRIAIRSPASDFARLSPEAVRYLILMDGQSNEELRAIAACLPEHPPVPVAD